MSTRGYVFYYDSEKDKYFGIYSHFDSYPNGLGKILVENYNTLDKVKEIISYGDASYIEETIADSVFYHRDRNEELSIHEATNFSELKTSAFREDYLYVFGNGFWKCYDSFNNYIEVEI